MMISASQKCFYMGNKWCLVFSKDAAECPEDKAYKVEVYLTEEKLYCQNVLSVCI